MKKAITDSPLTRESRPEFPKRVIISAGMPYGNKDLHFGHLGGCFVPADVFARFFRDRIGAENVIYVSGTDCYGSPIVESHRQLVEKGEFQGTLQDFVKKYHLLQKKALAAYDVDINLFAASSFSRAAELHEEVCGEFLTTLMKNGHIVKRSNEQFYDTKRDIFLNGRQVVGQCPIEGCKSEKGYADECALGHQYSPKDLLNPKSEISGETPEMRKVTNWYVNLSDFQEELKTFTDEMSQAPEHRPFVTRQMREFFEPPAVYVKKKLMEEVEAITQSLPSYTLAEARGKSVSLVFESLDQREQACEILSQKGIQYRSGKTLVPFRMTGNIEWGLPAPEIDDMKNLTFWVWPESLLSPISFSAAFLESVGKDKDAWREWWHSKDCQVFQFIGEDNLYFYGIAEIAMFMGMQGKTYSARPEEGQLQLPKLITNKHLLFLNAKASSSGKVKPPMAGDLLKYYTVDQLRAHFFAMGLGQRSVSLQPKPLDPKAPDKASDPVLNEGNLLSNVFNKAVRSVFYTMQKYCDGKYPEAEIADDILAESEEAILKFEAAMARHEFSQAFAELNLYVRGLNKYWDQRMKEMRDREDNDLLLAQTLVDMFHMIRVATVLLHPIAPNGTEKVLEYLNVDSSFWDWKHVFEPITSFMVDPETHAFKFLEPRVDFFEKHESQLPPK